MLNRPANNEKQAQILEWKNSCGNIDAATEKSIIELSEHNFARLQKLAGNLQRIGKFDSQTLGTALERVSKRIPKVAESTKSKSKLNEGSVHKLDNSTTFFMKKGASRNIFSSGGQSTISIGYSSSEAKEPSMSVKRLSLPNDAYTETKESLAIRETKNHQLLGRRAQWYTNKKGKVIVTDWQHGTALDELSEAMEKNHDSFSKYSFARRFAWLTYGLTELDTLHRNFRLHGDIKRGNFILDLDRDKMQLIDFGATQKVNSTKKFVKSPMFLDMNEGDPKKLSSDMFSMGYILCCLFPDLLDIGMKLEQRLIVENGTRMVATVAIPPYMTRKIKTDHLTPAENAVYALFDAMMEASAEDRCTSEQALQFCTEIAARLQNGNTLSAAELQNILGTTINRNTYSVEDALRDSVRPAKFGAIAEVRALKKAPVVEVAKPVTTEPQAKKVVSEQKTSVPVMFAPPPAKRDSELSGSSSKEQQRKPTGCTLM